MGGAEEIGFTEREKCLKKAKKTKVVWSFEITLLARWGQADGIFGR